MNTKEILKLKPYTFKTTGKFSSSHVLIYDGTELTNFYVRRDEMEHIVNLLNTAYREGYLKKELELL